MRFVSKLKHYRAWSFEVKYLQSMKTIHFSLWRKVFQLCLRGTIWTIQKMKLNIQIKIIYDSINSLQNTMTTVIYQSSHSKRNNHSFRRCLGYSFCVNKMIEKIFLTVGNRLVFLEAYFCFWKFGVLGMMLAEIYVLFVHWMMLIHCICVLRYQFCLFLRFFYCILELFRQCGISCFHFIWYTVCLQYIRQLNIIYINNMMSYTYMWQTIVTKISVFGTKTMISDRKTMYSAKYKASRVNSMVFHAEIEIFYRNVLQASHKNAKCLVSGTETFLFATKTPIPD